MTWQPFLTLQPHHCRGVRLTPLKIALLSEKPVPELRSAKGHRRGRTRQPIFKWSGSEVREKMSAATMNAHRKLPEGFLAGLMFSLLTVAFYSLACEGAETLKEVKPDLEGKKALIVIAHKNFRDEEFKEPNDLLKAYGCKVRVASSTLKKAKGMLGMEVKPDLLLKDVKVGEYDIIIFVGGIGAKEYFNSRVAHRIVRDAVKKRKILAAICIAPCILARAGALKGKRATCWPSERQDLKKHGAIVSKKDLVRDERVITASGPKAARDFARMLAKVLSELPKKAD